jgi:hypothetical protein
MHRIAVLVYMTAMMLFAGGVFILGNHSEGSLHRKDMLNTANWKLTIPVAQKGSETPQEIRQPQLSTYQSGFFRPNEADTGMVFRANVGGTPVVHGGFARTELREMTDGGTQKAAWSSAGSVNTLTIRESIDHLPPVRPAAVAGQIHGPGEEYVALIRIDGRKIWVKTEGGDAGTLADDYQLGTIFTVKLESSGNWLRFYYDSKLKVTVNYTCSGCYFKAGVYLQSSTRWDKPDAWGQVTIYDVKVSHQAS